MFPKAIPAIDNDSSNGSWKSQLKTFWKGFIILDAIKNTPDSGEKVKISTLRGVWKTLVPALTDDLEEFKTADVVELARELELEVEPEDVNELLQWMRS